MKLLDPLFRGSACQAAFSDAATVQGMLDFEAALARAEAAAGVIPPAAVPAIEAACRAERLDLDGIAADAARAGNLAIPLVKHLTAQVKAADEAAARFVHWGATSQDAIDSGFVLQLKQALAAVEADLERLIAALARCVAEHRHTVMVGRTWMQHALPTTFGLKLAGTLDALLRQRERLAEFKPRVLAVQFGGAAGTLASLGDAGLAVAQRLAEELELTLPATPWHGQRDRIAEVAAWFGSLTGVLGKLARDVSLLMQTDVAEAFEPAGAGRGGSSTMPHKRNPVSSAIVLSAAVRVPALVGTVFAAMVQEHERGLGGWHAEWEALPELIGLSAGALAVSAELVEGLEVHADTMRANLDKTGGLIMAEAVTMALGEPLGRLEAHKLIEAKCRQALGEGRHLKDVLLQEPRVTEHLSHEELNRLLDPINYTGVADALIERVLAAALAGN
ncbi:3-carboxy-cis,cis-muconate cycloisomerase [Pseudogulbenkiania sp. NH8B]|uniref:3-carboxy-cis,cis-muconate cycloisomerase n=1 Tax=Pseudogulbenkiania sp. (strain NH8B) TaxID=748280 RepID=UPI0002279942|nr:3-carboxy-cis,cis-muconate cycloisomerase [Pseudogulbenkiania sp. NH8B]BAK77311.1 3-carboxy-cis,cis-muconate cycloisomerase [Pseudogulbenkiania sp. NH8B]